jgi:hypothetical protein
MYINTHIGQAIFGCQCWATGLGAFLEGRFPGACLGLFFFSSGLSGLLDTFVD